jgi:hypothetical protein
MVFFEKKPWILFFPAKVLSMLSSFLFFVAVESLRQKEEFRPRELQRRALEYKVHIKCPTEKE